MEKVRKVSSKKYMDKKDKGLWRNLKRFLMKSGYYGSMLGYENQIKLNMINNKAIIFSKEEEKIFVEYTDIVEHFYIPIGRIKPERIYLTTGEIKNEKWICFEMPIEISGEQMFFRIIISRLSLLQGIPDDLLISMEYRNHVDISPQINTVNSIQYNLDF